MWLTIYFDESDPKWPPSRQHKVELIASGTLQGLSGPQMFRTSPIFPLLPDQGCPNLKEGTFYIFFYEYDPAFTVLGRAQSIGSDKLKESLWYTTGLASIVLITEDLALNEELSGLARSDLRAREMWTVKNGSINDIKCYLARKKYYDPESLKVVGYGSLPVATRAIVDEFVAHISMIVPKVAIHMPSEIDTFIKLVSQVNELVAELVYLVSPEGPPIFSLRSYDEELLRRDGSLRNTIVQQNLDRLIQVNSALSYVCPQALAGAVPILERRSLVRRASLLGIGSAILSLTRISRSIEFAFSQYPITDVITNSMVSKPFLSGLDRFPLLYDPTEWKNQFSVSQLSENVTPRNPDPKLPYFSGRLGFRETEYTISAAIQVITGGSSLEWSMLTITHEMLHGHVRSLLTSIFDGDPHKILEEKWHEFYEDQAKFSEQELGQENANALQSIRALLLSYCCLSRQYGSLTRKGNRKGQKEYYLPPENELWRLFESEWRNIGEVFVHILDFHYFYGTRLELYIPLVWCSWAAVPHVRSDLRQYILRSLLTIAAKETKGPSYDRFAVCKELLKELLGKYSSSVLNHPVIHEVLEYLNDDNECWSLLYPFRASLILVDLVNSIFVARSIRAKLIGDDLLQFGKNEAGFEDDFEYGLPDGFVGDVIQKPVTYILARVASKLKNPKLEDTAEEAETAMLFLACSSNLKVGG